LYKRSLGVTGVQQVVDFDHLSGAQCCAPDWTRNFEIARCWIGQIGDAMQAGAARDSTCRKASCGTFPG